MAWIRLDTDLEQDRRFRRLDGFGRALWPVLLRLCKKREGWLPAEDWDASYFADLMRFAEFEVQIENAMDAILEAGLMVHEGDRVVIRNWRSYQSTSAERMARKRATEKPNDFVEPVTHTRNARHSAPQYSTVQYSTGTTHACVSPLVSESDEQQDIHVESPDDETSKSLREQEIDLAFGGLHGVVADLARRICELWPDYFTPDALDTVQKARVYVDADRGVDWLAVVSDAYERWGSGDPLYYGGKNRLHPHLMSYFRNGADFHRRARAKKNQPETVLDNRGQPHVSRPRRVRDTSTDYQPANLDQQQVAEITRLVPWRRSAPSGDGEGATE